MHWNHRIVRVKDGDGSILTFTEVYYDDSNKPTGYGEPFMVGDSVEELRELVERLNKCLDQPIIDESEFPKREDQTDDDV